LVESLDKTVITITAIITSGVALLRALQLGYRLLKEWIAKDVYKAKYDEIIKKLIDSRKE
jgi:hypothetical protein